MIKKERVNIFVALIFTLAILFPTAVKFAHTVEGHQHEACTDFSTHIHTKQLDCSICDFHFSIFQFTPNELPEFIVNEGFQKTETYYFFPLLDSTTPHYFLRGPPLFS